MEAGELEYASWTEEQGKIPCVLYALCTRRSADKHARFTENRTARMPLLQGVDMRHPRMDQAFHRNGGVLDICGADISGSVHPSLTPCSNEAVIKGRNPALYDGKRSWQDDRVRFEVLNSMWMGRPAESD